MADPGYTGVCDMIHGRYVLLSELLSPFVGAPVYHCRETQTTMLDARELSDQFADGTVLWADFQHDGRGRGAGRRWAGEAGANLLFTLLVSRQAATPEDDPYRIGSIPLRAGLAVAEAAVAAGVEPRRLRIKWPNDVLIDGRKLCGVLCEGRSGGVERFHIGIGLNVNQEVFPDSLFPAPVSLCQAVGRVLDRRAVLMEVLRQLRRVLRAGSWRVAVEQRLFGVGSPVIVRLPASVAGPISSTVQTVSAIICGIGSDGSLRVRRKGGPEISVLQPDAVTYLSDTRSSMCR